MSERLIEPPIGPPPMAAPGPITQSAAIAFKVVYIVTLLLGVLWMGSNFRIISSDSQAVVMRFGRIARTQKAGLLLVLPRPFEQVRLLPGPDRQLSRPVAALAPSGGITVATTEAAGGSGVPANASPYLTGDGNVVLLDATLIYRINDPTAYVLAEDHVTPALDRMFRASAVHVAAGAALNDFLVTQTDDPSAAESINNARAAVRDDLLNGVNARLKSLAAQGQSLGVEVDRIDTTAWLPPEAKLAFDAVLTATQKADQNVAAANTAAELRRQGAEREADRLLSAAQAAAIEQTVTAGVDTTNIAAIVRAGGPRAALVDQSYRVGVAQVLNKAGQVITVDPKSGARFIISGQRK